MSLKYWFACAVAGGGLSTAAWAEVCNLRVVTDASPDYSDLPSLVHSVTAKWATPEEKCRALFYWNHIARRQTAPMLLHGVELTDPIRQFNDYGYTMCSTISGINCAIWHHLGLRARFWDISLHTVPEVFYDGRWHMYDNSMSALYTLCDGKTLAGVEDIGKEGACALSGGRTEPGHIARYHCLNATGPNGFLTGADTARSLEEEARCFKTNGLKYRYYYFNWDYGHRYILNLKASESYTRFYRSLGASAEYYVPNKGKDPDDRYHLRGNGVWHYRPELAGSESGKEFYSARNLRSGPEGLTPVQAGEPAEVIFKIQGANVITSQHLRAQFNCPTNDGQTTVAVSTDNGLHWHPVWTAAGTGNQAADETVTEPVNGAYEVLVKVTLSAATSGGFAGLKAFDAETTTMLNAKTQPRLNLGKNTVFIGAGPQTESIVFWPELQAGKYKQHVVKEKNIASTRQHPEYQGTVYSARALEEAYLVYRLDAPGDLAQVTFGGRFHNRAAGSHIDLFYSLDEGKTWTKSWSLRRTTPPWDVIHYETAQIPPRHRSVWVKYGMDTTEASPDGCSIYAVRLEADYVPGDTAFKPLEVTFDWSERQADRSLVERSHTQTIPRLPFRYTIDVGGADHPVVNWLRICQRGAVADTKEGYSDGKDAGGEKFVPRWETCGRNLALGRSYTLSKPSESNWGAGDDGKKLTSGAGAPSYAGGTSYRSAALWMANANPALTVDLGAPCRCASFGLNFHGYPWWDALKGQVTDKIEVLTSLDGRDYTPQGALKTDLRWSDLPVNFTWPDDETLTSATFRLVPPQAVNARYVKYEVKSKRVFACAGIEVLDAYELRPFDLRLALPDEAGPIASLALADDGGEKQAAGTPRERP